MSDSQDEKLETMLKSRRFRTASSDLAERIILKAQPIRQRHALPFMPWLKQLFAELHLPRPAYVLAGTLILGFVLGFNSPLHMTTADDIDADQVQSFLYADEDVL
jgi:hypothetical protein